MCVYVWGGAGVEREGTVLLELGISGAEMWLKK